MQIEVVNDGSQKFYDVYKLMRPDPELPVDQLEHRDAKFRVLTPAGKMKYVIGFNLREYEQKDEEFWTERSIPIVIKPQILIAAEREEARQLQMFQIRLEDGHYRMPAESLNRYNLIYKTACKTVNEAVSDIKKRVHGEYVTNMFREYQITFGVHGEPSMPAPMILEFNVQHNMKEDSVRRIVRLIRKGYIIPPAEKSEVNKIYPYAKFCISSKKAITTSTVDDARKYRKFPEKFDITKRYIYTAEKRYIGNSDQLAYEVTVTPNINGVYDATRTVYNEYGGIKEIIQFHVYNKRRKCKMTHTYYRGNIKDFRAGVTIPKEVSRTVISEYDRGVTVSSFEVEYDKFNRVIMQKRSWLNRATMYIESEEERYQTGRLYVKIETHPTDNDPWNYKYTEYDTRGDIVVSKSTDMMGRITKNHTIHAITRAFDVWDECQFVTSGAGVRIFDVDTGKYCDWKRIYKDLDTQDVTLKLSSL